MPTLLIFGLGYLGAAVARQAEAARWTVEATSRNPARGLIDPADSNALRETVMGADALLVTAAPPPRSP